MKKIIECIPNFSEGRDQKTVNAIAEAITSVPGIILLGCESDIDHNRSVISFAGPPEAVIEAAFLACKKASQLIDLNKHRGVHPRIGAMDVCPFVPISGITYKECVEYALKLGKRIGQELRIPVYMYEKAAQKPEHKNLADIRKGQYENLKKQIGKNTQPDFGPSKMGPAGATAIGVRPPLVAYNINLDSSNMEIAKLIAKKIREKDGGLPYVKALGLPLASKGIVQVSMNLTNYKKTGMLKVFRAVKEECQKHHIKILESEIIGLVPQDALKNISSQDLQLKNFSDKKILEKALG